MAFHYTFIPVGALFHSAPRLEKETQLCCLLECKRIKAATCNRHLAWKFPAQ